MGCFRPFALVVLLVPGLLLVPAQGSDTAKKGASATLPSLSLALVKQAPGVIDYLQKHAREFSIAGKLNVGVLKFESSGATSETHGNLGMLNTGLAERLQIALALANDLENPVNLIRDASAVAARIQGTDRTVSGRKKLFGREYPLAWGKKKVKPGAFITGQFSVSEDLTSVTVALRIFGRDGEERNLGKPFRASGDLDVLGEMGESFTLRTTGGAGGAANLEKCFKEAVVEARSLKKPDPKGARRDKKKRHPLDPNNPHPPPVRLEVRYGKPDEGIPFKAVKIRIKDGQAFVRSPKPGEEVQLVLVRDSSKKKYGVVVKVNGESTYLRERAVDSRCTLWVLTPDKERWPINGYQDNEGEYRPFRVLSAEESAKRASVYGRDAGLINVAVYEEGPPEDMAVASAKEPDESAFARLVALKSLPVEPRNAEALMEKLLKMKKRGGSLMVPDQKKRGQKLVRAPFTGRLPVANYSVRYFTPEEK
jgi:uncharacterized C2H2 Zn-finger protein